MRRWVVVIVVGLLVGAGVGYYVGQSSAKRVSYSELLVLGALSADATTDSALASNQYVNQRMPTYAALAVSDLTTKRATDQLGIEPGSLGGAITATAILDTTVVTVAVTARTPQDAQARNAAVTAALQQAIEQTENAAGLPPRVQLTLVSAASLPEPAPAPASVFAVIGAVVGLVAGALAGVVLARRERAERSRRAAFEASLPPVAAPPGARSAPAPKGNGRPAPRQGLQPRRQAPVAGGETTTAIPSRERP